MQLTQFHKFLICLNLVGYNVNCEYRDTRVSYTKKYIIIFITV